MDPHQNAPFILTADPNRLKIRIAERSLDQLFPRSLPPLAMIG